MRDYQLAGLVHQINCVFLHTLAVIVCIFFVNAAHANIAVTTDVRLYLGDINNFGNAQFLRENDWRSTYYYLTEGGSFLYPDTPTTGEWNR